MGNGRETSIRGAKMQEKSTGFEKKICASKKALKFSGFLLRMQARMLTL